MMHDTFDAGRFSERRMLRIGGETPDPVRQPRTEALNGGEMRNAFETFAENPNSFAAQMLRRIREFRGRTDGFGVPADGTRAWRGRINRPDFQRRREDFFRRFGLTPPQPAQPPAPSPAPQPETSPPPAPQPETPPPAPRPEPPQPELQPQTPPPTPAPAPRRVLTDAEKKALEEQYKEESELILSIEKDFRNPALGPAEMALYNMQRLRQSCAKTPGYDLARLDAALKPLEDSAKSIVELGTKLKKDTKDAIRDLRTKSEELEREANDTKTRRQNRGIGTRFFGEFNGDNRDLRDLEITLRKKSSAMSAVSFEGVSVEGDYARLSGKTAFLAKAYDLLGRDDNLSDVRNRVNNISPALGPIEFLKKRGWDPAKRAVQEGADFAQRNVVDPLDRAAREGGRAASDALRRSGI